MEVLPHIVVVEEILFVTENHRRRQRKVYTLKKQTLNEQKIWREHLEQIATNKNNYSSSQTVETHPLHRDAKDHSTLQLSRSLVGPLGSFYERSQSWRELSSFYCPLVTLKWRRDINLFKVGELLFWDTGLRYSPYQ